MQPILTREEWLKRVEGKEHKECYANSIKRVMRLDIMRNEIEKLIEEYGEEAELKFVLVNSMGDIGCKLGYYVEKTGKGYAPYD